MQSLEELNNVLLRTEREAYDELQAARKPAVEYFEKKPNNRSFIGVKRLGVLDEQLFTRAV
ncbi:hypothetical protein AMTR_s00014p00247410 [Amborella trichopoda]|uniref:Uncharacterized protein n=1 Tax=Amborella trichopoda TaxID=13333 RepID=W1PMD6_AMBTC|nr:hypothetical protein AMTR_s00014p00247410 [Amborella trichopoda]